MQPTPESAPGNASETASGKPSADAESSSQTALTPGQLRALLIVLCAGLALVVAGNSALAIALPDIAADLEADQSELTWIIDAYALTFAALLLTAGIAADRIGRRTILVIGLVIFGAACVASAFSPDAAWFTALRAVSGVGAAAVFPVTLSALVDAYPEERRTFAIGVWSGVSSAGAVAGTIVAGALLEAFWWGSVQLLFGGLALALIVPVVFLVAQNRNPALSLDPLGALWSVVALGGLVYGIIEGPQNQDGQSGWFAPTTLIALAVGVIGFVAFIVHQLRAKVPSLDVRLFTNRGLAAGSIIVTVQFFASLGFFVLSPQYLQIVLEYSPLGSALALLVIPVGVGAGIGIATGLTRRFGARLPGALGLLLMGVGFAIFATGLREGLDASLWVMGAGVLLFGIGFGMGITPGTELIIAGLPAERRSVASAVNDITREVGGVLGIAVLSSILVSFYRAEIGPALEGLPDQVREVADSGAGAAVGLANSFGPAGEGLATAAREAFATGLSEGQGFDVAALYLRGYHPSVLQGPYDLALLVDDLFAVLDALGWTDPVYFIGHDYGAQIGFAALAQHPERFRAAVTLSGAHPAAIARNTRRHPKQVWLSRYIIFFQFGAIAERRVARDDFAFIERLWNRWAPRGGLDREHRDRVKATIRRSMPAPIAMYRGGGFAIAETPVAVPTLFITGQIDGCSLPQMSDGQERMFAAAYEREVWPGTGHFPQLEQPKRTARAVQRWLSRY